MASEQSFHEFLTDPPRYDASGSPNPWLAIPVTLAILLGGQLLAFLLVSAADLLAAVDHRAPVPQPGGGAAPGTSEGRLYALTPGSRDTASLMQFAFLSQLAMVALTLAAGRWSGLARTLKLVPLPGGLRTCLYALLAMLPLIGAINLFAYLIGPELMARDFRSFLELARAPGVVTTALVIGLGAPVSEELLFRGYLLSALAGTRLGYWLSAALATFGWTLLHIEYSWLGLVEVFALGMYFSWLLWRTGSLWPPLICHATYNACLLALLRLGPF